MHTCPGLLEKASRSGCRAKCLQCHRTGGSPLPRPGNHVGDTAPWRTDRAGLGSALPHPQPAPFPRPPRLEHFEKNL